GVFKGVRELKPAHGGFFSENGFAASAYWRLEAKAHTESFEETLAHVKNLVLDAIRRQSGAPVCSMLSGGLDSSVIAAVSGVKETFSVDYEENELFFKATAFQPDSDKKYIDAMTAFLGGKHTNIVLGTDDLVESLFLAVHARDLPGMADVDGSMLLFCRAIRADYAAALSGECADELFGGYPWYRDEKIRETDGFPWSQSTAYRASFLKDGALGAIDPVKYVYEKYSETVRGSAVLPGESALEKRMKEMYQLNLHWFMQTLIDRGDRMSGVSGLEIRMPFCDRRIAEYAYNIPWAFKNYKGREKGLLREAKKGMLPEEVLWRKKSPYPKTHHPKYLKKVSEILSDILSTPTAPLHQLIKKEALAALLPAENAAPGTQPWYGQLMTAPQTIAYFIQLNEWLSHYKVSVI
ncbi:MAG: asparagine synthase C-terminal domain-containing protein, partial [Clostridiales bacterium]|nr:asparagine synthase C-terminal domain-containing protein [Clostridiales bacterium]